MNIKNLITKLSALPTAISDSEIISVTFPDGNALLKILGEDGSEKELTLAEISAEALPQSSFEDYAFAMYIAKLGGVCGPDTKRAFVDGELKNNRVFYMTRYCLSELIDYLWVEFEHVWNECASDSPAEALQLSAEELEAIMTPSEVINLSDDFISAVLKRAFELHSKVFTDTTDSLPSVLCYDAGVDASVLEEYQEIYPLTEASFQERCNALEGKAKERGFEICTSFIDHKHLNVMWYDALDVVADIRYGAYDISFIVEGDSFGKVEANWSTTEFCNGLYQTDLGNRIQCDSVLDSLDLDDRIAAELSPQVFIYIEKDGDGEEPEEYEGYVCDNVLSCVEDNLDLVLDYIDNKERDAHIRSICESYGADYKTELDGYDHCSAIWYDQNGIASVKYHGYNIEYDVCGEIRADIGDIFKANGGAALLQNAGVKRYLQNDTVLSKKVCSGELTFTARNWVNIVILDADGNPVCEPDSGSSDNVLECVEESLKNLLEYIDNNLTVPGGSLPYTELRRRYYSHSGRCGCCGVLMSTRVGCLGELFPLSKDGDFYCINCDGNISQQRQFVPDELLRSDK